MIEEEEEAWERDREADPSDPIARVFPAQFPSGLPPFLSNQARSFFRYVAHLHRVRQRNAAGLPMAAQDWLSEWLYLCEFDISQKTRKRYERIIRRFLSWFQSQHQQPLTLVEVTLALVTSYSFALQQEVSVSTVRYHLQVLRQWCCMWSMQSEDIFADTLKQLGLLINGLKKNHVQVSLVDKPGQLP